MNTNNRKRIVRSETGNKAAVARLARSAAEMVRNAFAPSGCVRTRFLSEIESLPDAEAAIRAYSVTLGPRIAEAIHEEIRDTFARARDAVSALNTGKKHHTPSVPPAILRFAAEAPVVSFMNETLFSRMRNIFFGGIFGCTVGQLLGYMFARFGFRSAMLIAPFACCVVGIIGGFIDMRRRSCHGYKAKLACHVNTIIAELQSKYFTPMQVGAISEIDRCLAVICGAVPDRLPTYTGNPVRTHQTAHDQASSEKTGANNGIRRISSGLGLIRNGVCEMFAQAKANLGRCLLFDRQRFHDSKGMKKLRQIVSIIRS